MSLPPAQKDISARPAKGSVTDPLDKAKKDKDVERKLKLYTSIQALRASCLPSNAQIDSLLSYFQRNVENVDKETAISADTKRLLADFNSILEAIKVEVNDKNRDELLQDLIWRTRPNNGPAETLDQSDASGPGKKVVVDKDKAKEDGSQALHHIRTIFNLLVTNSEARKLVTDLSVIGRDLLSRGAAKAASAIAPSPEQLAVVDDSTRRDHFVDRDEFGEKIEKVKSEASEAPKPAIENTVAEADAVTSDDAEVTAEEVQEKKKGIFKRLGGRVPEKHKTVASEQFNKGKRFLTEDYFPKDRRDQWIWRVKKVIIECQGHPEYQSSLRWLLDFVEEYYGHGMSLADHHASNSTEKFNTPEVKRTFSDIRVLLDRFADNKSFETLIMKRLNTVAEDARNDKELHAWWNRLARYVRNLLLEPGYVTEPKSETDGRKLLDEARHFYGTGSSTEATVSATDSGVVTGSATPGKYRVHLDNFLDGLNEYLTGISNNENNKQFANSVSRFTKDLLFVDDGDSSKLTFKNEMWGDVRRVILPLIVDNVGYIPIPRIEYTDESLDLVVENLTLSGKNLFPNLIAIEAHNYMRFSPYSSVKKTDKDDTRHEFIITLSQMQADMRDVAFYFDKKSGIPRLRDSGLADVVVGGDGVTVTIHLVSSKNDPASFFQVKNINVKIDTLKFSIRDSKHDLLYKTLRPLATNLIKKQIAKAIRDGLETGLSIVDGQLIGVRDRIQEAKKTSADSQEGSIATLRGFFQRSKSREPSISGTEISASQSQFKVVSNKRNSLLATKGHPAGWVNRANDKTDFVQASDGSWRSNAFDLNQTNHPVAATA